MRVNTSRTTRNFSAGKGMCDNSIEIIRYQPDLKDIWNDFVESSKNGTFLFNRSYMDYHSDRFPDHSYLIYRKRRLYCLLPGCTKDNVFYSHAGLTYGGLIMNENCSAEGILKVFTCLIREMSEEGITRIIYKPIPHIYHRYAAEEDLYALFRNKASLFSRNISSSINLKNHLKKYHDRKTALNRAIRNKIEVKECDDYKSFWHILEENLRNKYKSKPVHSLKEILYLSRVFPDNIKLWGAFIEETMVAGTVCYYTHTVIHTQYISANPEGKKAGAVDMLIDHLMKSSLNEEHSEIEWLDLGTSNEDNGLFLNENLVYQKEGFGGRGICYDTYEISIS